LAAVWRAGGGAAFAESAAMKVGEKKPCNPTVGLGIGETAGRKWRTPKVIWPVAGSKKWI